MTDNSKLIYTKFFSKSRLVFILSKHLCKNTLYFKSVNFQIIFGKARRIFVYCGFAFAKFNLITVNQFFCYYRLIHSNHSPLPNLYYKDKVLYSALYFCVA